jgi:hypothetical protein
VRLFVLHLFKPVLQGNDVVHMSETKVETTDKITNLLSFQKSAVSIREALISMIENFQTQQCRTNIKVVT